MALSGLKRRCLFGSKDGHHCFIVRYRSGEDLGLDMHTDDSDVTFNLCLGLEFTGAGLQFCGMAGAADHRKHRHSYLHRKARAIEGLKSNLKGFYRPLIARL